MDSCAHGLSKRGLRETKEISQHGVNSAAGLRSRGGRANSYLFDYSISAAKVAAAGSGQLTGVPMTYRP